MPCSRIERHFLFPLWRGIIILKHDFILIQIRLHPVLLSWPVFIRILCTSTVLLFIFPLNSFNIIMNALLDSDGDYDVKILNPIAFLLSSFISFSRKSTMATLDSLPLVLHCLNCSGTQVSYDRTPAHSMPHCYSVCSFLVSQSSPCIWTLLLGGNRREPGTARWHFAVVAKPCHAPSSGSCSGLSWSRSGLLRRPKAIADKFCSNKIILLIIAVKMVDVTNFKKNINFETRISFVWCNNQTYLVIKTFNVFNSPMCEPLIMQLIHYSVPLAPILFEC